MTLSSHHEDKVDADIFLKHHTVVSDEIWLRSGLRLLKQVHESGGVFFNLRDFALVEQVDNAIWGIVLVGLLYYISFIIPLFTEKPN